MHKNGTGSRAGPHPTPCRSARPTPAARVLPVTVSSKAPWAAVSGPGVCLTPAALGASTHVLAVAVALARARAVLCPCGRPEYWVSGWLSLTSLCLEPHSSPPSSEFSRWCWGPPPPTLVLSAWPLGAAPHSYGRCLALGGKGHLSPHSTLGDSSKVSRQQVPGLGSCSLNKHCMLLLASPTAGASSGQQGCVLTALPRERIYIYT